MYMHVLHVLFLRVSLYMSLNEVNLVYVHIILCSVNKNNYTANMRLGQTRTSREGGYLTYEVKHV